MNQIFSVLLISVLLFGCATVGAPIKQNSLTQIKEGITTEKEVLSILGNPQMKTLNSDGKTIMLYSYTKVSNRAENFIPIVGLFTNTMDMNQQMLTILLDKSGVVEKYTMNDSDSKINSGLFNR